MEVRKTRKDLNGSPKRRNTKTNSGSNLAEIEMTWALSTTVHAAEKYEGAGLTAASQDPGIFCVGLTVS